MGAPIDRAAAPSYFRASILLTRAPGFVSGRHGPSAEGPAQDETTTSARAGLHASVAGTRSIAMSKRLSSKEKISRRLGVNLW
ncbi:MAG: hypothetical protein OXH64_07795, partial [Rhodospirillaceae bacterium]|nr:hypothetical protein [Rhodospirillaceae bacterium]